MRWIPFVMLLYREVRRFLRVFVQTVITPLINASLYLFIFGVSLGDRIAIHENYTYLAFLIPGLVMMSAMNNAFMNSSGSIVTAKFCGELEDLKATPLSAQQIVWAFSLGAVLRGWMVGIVTLTVGEVFHHHVHGTFLPITHPLTFVFFVTLGCLIFAKLGIWLGFIATHFDQLNGVTAFVLLPLLYLGGVFFSIEGLQPLWQLIAKANPVLYLINGVRFGAMGISDVTLTQATLLSLLGLAGVHALALYGVQRGSFERW